MKEVMMRTILFAGRIIISVKVMTVKIMKARQMIKEKKLMFDYERAQKAIDELKSCLIRMEPQYEVEKALVALGLIIERIEDARKGDSIPNQESKLMDYHKVIQSLREKIANPLKYFKPRFS